MRKRSTSRYLFELTKLQHRDETRESLRRLPRSLVLRYVQQTVLLIDPYIHMHIITTYPYIRIYTNNGNEQTLDMENDDASLPELSATSLELLGVGVSGHVFAIDEHTVVKTALVTADSYTDRQSLRDHLVEWKIYERLGEHPRICRLGRRVKRGLVLERLKECLRQRLVDLQRLNNERPSPDTALRWSVQAAEGLAYIHARHVLQGDIGCHNLLLDHDDNVKFCDFAGSSIDGSSPYVACGKGFRRPVGDPDKGQYP